MPLIKPEIQKVLRQAGLEGPASAEDNRPLSEKLDAAGLSIDNTLELLSELTRSGNEALRLRAIETSLKVHGAMKETAPAAPSFTLVIQESPHLNPPDSSFQSTAQAAGIPSNVNPILLPRQLINKLKVTPIDSQQQDRTN